MVVGVDPLVTLVDKVVSLGITLEGVVTLGAVVGGVVPLGAVVDDVVPLGVVVGFAEVDNRVVVNNVVVPSENIICPFTLKSQISNKVY